jgi:hypothetical protein
MGKKFILFKSFKKFTFAINLMVFLTFGGSVLAEGSKDLYPSGKTGRRAYLVGVNFNSTSWPFINLGVHYVYAKVGERIAIASSAQGTGTSRIRLIDPSGTEVVNNTSGGNISNRTAELAGPRLFGQAAGGNRYLPIYHLVATEGLYKVEFSAQGTVAPSTSMDADSNWVEIGDGGIRAWDVSVINTNNSGFVNGRVYTNVMNLTTGTTSPHNTGFYGIYYILTKDGYTYRVNNNGNNGMYFTFMVNNNGFLDPVTGDPIYKSLTSSPAPAGQVHNPNNADTDKQITHKIFYNLPDSTLPTQSVGAVPGNSTWLKNQVTEPEVLNVSLIGVEGSEGQVGNKGGIVSFTANNQGSYKIIIESESIPADFPSKVLYGAAVVGLNQIHWDGTDGTDTPLPDGNFPIRVIVQLNGAEVHFPFFDMEYNRFGTIVELLNHNDLSQVVSNIVYWNDTDIPNHTNGSNPSPKNNSHLPPANSTGISSLSNGHIFAVGASSSGDTFGNERSIDTWTFITGPSKQISSLVEVKTADLKISQISANATVVTLGSDFDLVVKAKNDGPSDAESAKFKLFIPAGLEPQNIQFQGNSCGVQDVPLVYDPVTHSFSSTLDLPNGCEITYTIRLHVWEPMDVNSIAFTGTILRPNDYTDPDATNPDINIPPTDPFYECENNGAGGTCNNIQVLNLTYDTSSNCYNPLEYHPFTWNEPAGSYSESILVEDAELGYMLDFYSLNHSFTLMVNTVLIHSSDLEFGNGGGLVTNVEFENGDKYGIHTMHNGNPAQIWEMEGSIQNPLLRLKISPSGRVELWGAKTSGGELFKLRLINGNEFTVVPWNASSTNEVVLSQNQSSNLIVNARGYSLKVVKCPCVKPGLAGTPVQFAQVGILTKNSSDATWPQNVPNGYLALDSASKGLVINHLTTEERDDLTPIEGMIIYNVDLGCVQLFRGTNPTNVAERTGWNCIERSCND